MHQAAQWQEATWVTWGNSCRWWVMTVGRRIVKEKLCQALQLDWSFTLYPRTPFCGLKNGFLWLCTARVACRWVSWLMNDGSAACTQRISSSSKAIRGLFCLQVEFWEGVQKTFAPRKDCGSSYKYSCWLNADKEFVVLVATLEFIVWIVMIRIYLKLGHRGKCSCGFYGFKRKSCEPFRYFTCIQFRSE